MVLESEGHVRRQAPTGTVVSHRLPMRIGSFSDEVVRSGAEPGDTVLWSAAHRPSAAAREALELAKADRVHVVARLRTADREPIALETTSFPVSLTPGLLDEPLTGSLWAILRRRYGLEPARAEATFEMVTLDEETARLLDARVAAPAIRITRRTFDPRGRCIEHATDVYRADRVRFEVEADIPKLRRRR